MSKIFDIDSPVMRFLTRVADLMILNILMILCCESSVMKKGT